MSLSTKHHDYVLFYFCNFLAHNYEEVDSIDSSNTFQSQLRTMMEKINFITVDNFTFDKLENPIFFAPHKRGVIKINLLDRLQLYRDIFYSSKNETETEFSGDHVYLMLNKRNNYIKIGKSKTLGFREKTLQADEPEVVLVVTWHAPAKVEKELHRMFSDKRKRGEWFNLKLKELKIIKEYMKLYLTK
ncbi:GIY-YIG nuclease family protein [Lacibacter sp. H375]|uniref:GIY-YIG nuclease family protein n=1 Tax=Lacibacter sp. H375 TaxID=3133424 RepID=UPI0030BF4A56